MHKTTIPFNSRSFWGKALETFITMNTGRSSKNRSLSQSELTRSGKKIILASKPTPSEKEAWVAAQKDIDVFFSECNETIDAGVEVLAQGFGDMCQTVDEWVSSWIPLLPMPVKEDSESDDAWRIRFNRVKEHNRLRNWCLFEIRLMIQSKYKTIYNREA